MSRPTILISMILGFLLLSGIASTASVNSTSALSSTGFQMEETSLGDLVADAVRDAAQTPIAFIAAGSMREISIPSGKIDSDDILKCLQYSDDKIAVVDLTGKQIVNALERSVSILPQKNLGFLQVSGVKFTVDQDAPKGSRVSGVEIGRQKLNESETYGVAMPVPLADGAYGYFTIWAKEKPKPQKTTLSKAVTDFLDAKTSIDYSAKNRIATK